MLSINSIAPVYFSGTNSTGIREVLYRTLSKCIGALSIGVANVLMPESECNANYSAPITIDCDRIVRFHRV